MATVLDVNTSQQNAKITSCIFCFLQLPTDHLSLMKQICIAKSLETKVKFQEHTAEDTVKRKTEIHTHKSSQVFPQFFQAYLAKLKLFLLIHAAEGNKK